MKFSEETLMAYADNELDSQTRSEVEAAMAADPDIARRVAQHKALRGKLRATFDKVLHEPPPQRLIDTARGVPPVRREGNVIPLRRKQPQRRGWPQWASLAATLIVGVIIGHALLRIPLGGGGDSPVTSRNGQVLANGALAQALSDQLASTQAPDAPVRIGVSFKSKAGAYCRTFTLHEAAALAGLACRDHDDWRVQVLAQNAQARAPAESEPNSTSTGYRQAGSQIPHSILQAVEDNITGDPLDAHAEAQARDQHWTAP